MARALNYVGPDGADNGPSVELGVEGMHCRAIAESRHPDVMEMDAASRTGVGDIRELIEGVRYAPTQANYKVYIIDEVHMLSTAAFNALLKTLEEPPPHVKFVFATTEIRKVPVTVLSRCQRFDLRRIDPETLCNHLSAIAEKEGVTIDAEGLSMIARAAEGSVRDALSILDQAIVQQKAQPGEAAAISGEAIRDMLGLADRSLLWELLEATLGGDAKAALTSFESQYNAGADPAVILRDLLDIVHLLTRIKAAGPGAGAHGPAGEAEQARAVSMAEKLSLNALTRVWSLLMKGLSETNSAPDPSAAGEMAIIRICYASDLPTPDEALRALKKNSSAGVSPAPSPSISTNRNPPPAVDRGIQEVAPPPTSLPSSKPPPSPQPAKPSLNSLADIVRLAGQMRDAKLRTELESYVHIVSFSPGRIDMRLGEEAPRDLRGRLTQRLKEWTDEPWVVSEVETSEGAKTLRDARMDDVLAAPIVQKVMELFPGAEITALREIDIALAPDEMEEEPPIDPDDDPRLDDDALAGATRDRRDG